MHFKRDLLVTGCTSVLLALWCIPLPADEKGEAVLREAFKKLHAARSFTSSITQTLNVPGQEPLIYKGTIAALKPNFLRVELAGPEQILYVSDGKSYYTYQGGANEYMRMQVAPAPTEFMGQWEGEIDGFFGGEKNVARATVTYVGVETLGGVECDVVKAEPKPGTPGAPVTYAIGRDDRVIRRAILSFRVGGARQVTQANVLTDLALNPPLKEGHFEFTPPTGARLAQPLGMALAAELEASLLPVGSQAPHFAAPSPSGDEINLSDTLKTAKAVLVSFWVYGCPVCQAEVPHLQRLYSELKAGGLEVVAVNTGDAAEVINRYLNAGSFTFRVAMGAKPAGDGKNYEAMKQYRVRTYPTNYLIDSEGKIAYRGIGFGPANEQKLRDALAKLGVK